MPTILGVPSDICATAEASNFTFDMQLLVANAHHKTTTRGKRRRGLGLGKLPNISGYALYFCNGRAACNVLLALAEPFVKLNIVATVETLSCFALKTA